MLTYFRFTAFVLEIAFCSSFSRHHRKLTCGDSDRIRCKNADSLCVLRAEEWLNNYEEDPLGLIEPGENSMQYFLSTLNRDSLDRFDLQFPSPELRFTPVLTDLAPIKETDMWLHGWVALGNTNFSCQGMGDCQTQILHSLAAAPSVHSVHFLRPQEAQFHQYHDKVFPFSAPAVAADWPPAGHGHPLIRMCIKDLASHVSEHGKLDGEQLLWAVTAVLEDTRLWFYQCSVDGKCLDLIIQMGKCFCTRPTFCYHMFMQRMGIAL